MKRRCLILTTDKTYREASLEYEPDSYKSELGDSTEALASYRDYVMPRKKGTKGRLSFYVRWQERARDLPINPWCDFLALLGLNVSMSTPIYGEILILSSEKGKDISLDPYITELVKEYIVCNDEVNFLHTLEKRIKGINVDARPKPEPQLVLLKRATQERQTCRTYY